MPRTPPLCCATGSKRRSTGDPRLASRLNLWARRLPGEALTHAQQISAGPAFLDGLAGAAEDRAGGPARGLAAELAAARSRRMSQLGLAG